MRRAERERVTCRPCPLSLSSCTPSDVSLSLLEQRTPDLSTLLILTPDFPFNTIRPPVTLLCFRCITALSSLSIAALTGRIFSSLVLCIPCNYPSSSIKDTVVHLALSSIYFPPLGSRGIPRGATRSGQTQHIIRMGMKAATVSVECFRAFSTNQNCCTPFFLRESTIPALLYLLLNLCSFFISYSVSSSAQGATRYRCCKPKSSHHVRGTVLPPPDLHQRSRGTAKPY